MTQPSAAVDAIVTSLRTLLGPAAVDVRAHAGDLGADGKDWLTFRAPCVLVACLGSRITGEIEPPQALLQFAVFCIARSGTADRSDVAMDLAALVQGHVMRHDWGNAAKAAMNISADNHHTPELAAKGAAIWSVSWSQLYELTPADTAGVLHKLREISTTYAMGDAQTPDIQHSVVFP